MLAKRKILVVENDVFQYNAITAFLTEKKFGILHLRDNEAIGSYDEALEAIEQETPDITILDIELDGKKDGIELAEYLQPLNIPVIFLTAKDNQQNLDRAKHLLPKGFISKTQKPYDERNLWSALTMAKQYVEEKKKYLAKSISIKVKAVKLSINPSLKISDDADNEWSRREKLFDWDEILYFRTGKDTRHNYIVIKTAHSIDIGYEFKESLTEFEKKAPSTFVGISRNFLVNTRKITSHDLPGKIYVNEEMTVITDSYRNSASLKIRQILNI